MAINHIKLDLKDKNLIGKVAPYQASHGTTEWFYG